MRTFKFNVSLLVAVIVTTTAFTTQANFSGQKVITRCFYGVTLKNCSNMTVELRDQTCQQAKSLVVQYPYVASASLASSYENESGCIGNQKFCCVKITEMLSTDPGYNCAPFLDLGEGPKKYKVASSNDVFCKEE